MGLVMVSLYAYIFYQANLFSDFILHLIYVVLNLYGWWYWVHGGKKSEVVRVSTLDKVEKGIWTSVILLGFLVWGTLMGKFTNADFAYADAFTTVASLVAQFLMAKKKIENWVIWIIVDIVAIQIYFLKELYFTAGLYLVFLLLCIFGFRTWQRSLSIETARIIK